MVYVSHVNYKALVEKHGKRCPACKQKKPADEFNVARERHDGRAGYCKACVKIKYAETKRRYDKSRAGKDRKSKFNKKSSALKKFRDATDLKDQMYASHFRSEHEKFGE